METKKKLSKKRIAYKISDEPVLDVKQMEINALRAEVEGLKERVDELYNTLEKPAPAPVGLDERIKKIKELTDIQCSNGNWDYDPYMHGMANGILLAVTVLDDKEPVYQSAPEKWLSDKAPNRLLSRIGDNIAEALAMLNKSNSKFHIISICDDWAVAGGFMFYRGLVPFAKWRFTNAETLADFIIRNVKEAGR